MAFTQGISQVPIINDAIAGASAACLASVAGLPFENIKTRLQLTNQLVRSTNNSSFLREAQEIFTHDGLLGFARGASASLLRQSIYSFTRFGTYSYLLQNSISHPDTAIWRQLCLTIPAGFIGAVFSSPIDLVLVRMQSDSKIAFENRRNYRNVFHALGTITKEEGFLNLWKGCVSNILRAVVITSAQFVSYSQIKNGFLSSGHKDNIFCHLYSSLTAGLVTSLFSAPVDNIRTRVMFQLTEGAFVYHGIGDTVTKIIRKEGFLALWKGITPLLGKVIPNMTIMFIGFEQVSRLLNSKIK